MSYTFAHGCVLGRVMSLVRFSFVFFAHVLWTGVKGRYVCNTKIEQGDDTSSVLIHVDVHRADFYAQAKPNTDVKEPEEE